MVVYVKRKGMVIMGARVFKLSIIMNDIVMMVIKIVVV